MANEKRDWTALGIMWKDGVVHLDKERTDAHRAILPVITDVQKFLAWVGNDRAASIMNGSNSPTVAAQAMNRRAAEKGHGFDWVKDQFFNWVMRLRVGAAVVHLYPDGTKYFGTDEAQYRKEYQAKLFDLGVPMERAEEVAGTVAW